MTTRTNRQKWQGNINSLLFFYFVNTTTCIVDKIFINLIIKLLYFIIDYWLELNNYYMIICFSLKFFSTKTGVLHSDYVHVERCNAAARLSRNIYKFIEKFFQIILAFKETIIIFNIIYNFDDFFALYPLYWFNTYSVL